MISHKHKCVFIHIPKTAGMSVESAFLKSLGLQFRNGQASELLLTYNNDPKKGPPSLAHLTANEYVKLGYLSQEKYDSYFTFTFVRNPWERTLSLYKNFGFHRMMSFKNFLKYEMPFLYKKRYYFIKPQVEYFLDESGKCQVDFIGKFENLKDDFKTITSSVSHPVDELQKINLSSIDGKIFNRWNLRFILKRLVERPTRVFRLNLTARKRLVSGLLYDEMSKRVVANYYKKDIEYFKYSFPEDLSRF